MEAAKRLAIVKIHPAIRDIQNMQRRRESVAEILADGEIEACVLRQMIAWVGGARKGVAEAGAVINVCGGKGLRRKSDFSAEVESIALIVIKGK